MKSKVTLVLKILPVIVLVCSTALLTDLLPPADSAHQQLGAEPAIQTNTSVGQVPTNVSSRVYIDPATGKFAQPPASRLLEETNDQIADATSMETAGLQEIASPVPNGGTMVRLNGRFRNLQTATIDKASVLHVDCAQASTDIQVDASRHEDCRGEK